MWMLKLKVLALDVIAVCWLNRPNIRKDIRTSGSNTRLNLAFCSQSARELRNLVVVFLPLGDPSRTR
jgi:hypothetical protein